MIDDDSADKEEVVVAEVTLPRLAEINNNPWVMSHSWLNDRLKLEAVIRGRVCLDFCQVPLAELAVPGDDTLFKDVLNNKQHVFHQLGLQLPDRLKNTWNHNLRS